VHALTASYGIVTPYGYPVDIPIGTSTTQFATTIQCAPTSAGYQYYYTDSFQSISTQNWNKTGSLSAVTGEGLVSQTSGGGNLISNVNNVPIQGPNANNYEVSSDVVLAANGGYFVQYLRASSGALSDGSTGTGSYIAVELQNPTFNPTCSAQLAVYEAVIINGITVVTPFNRTPIKCQTPMKIRSVVFGTSLNVMVNGVVYSYDNLTLTSGAPGVGGRAMPNGSSIADTSLGPWDNVAPAEVNQNTFTTTVYFSNSPSQPGSVMAQWQGAVDNPAGGPNPGNGSGVAYYTITRNTISGTDTNTPSFQSFDASFYDGTVVQGNIYGYSITACDFHGNCGTTLSDMPVATGEGTVDGHRIGIHPTGSYWGGGGEQLDLLSGNLNYSLPLFTAIGRNGLKPISPWFTTPRTGAWYKACHAS
jgi:hypothetical protein